MHLLCPRLQRQDRTEPGSQEIIPGQPSLPGNRQDLCFKGYVIDHVVPLKRGGADSPGNMQWQSLSSARAKDRIE